MLQTARHRYRPDETRAVFASAGYGSDVLVPSQPANEEDVGEVNGEGI